MKLSEFFLDGALRGPPVQCSVYYYEWRLATTNEGGTNVAKLTDKQRKKIIAESVNGSSIRAFGLYRWDEKAAEDRPLKTDDHAMDDTRYFVRAAFQPSRFSF